MKEKNGINLAMYDKTLMCAINEKKSQMKGKGRIRCLRMKWGSMIAQTKKMSNSTSYSPTITKKLRNHFPCMTLQCLPRSTQQKGPQPRNATLYFLAGQARGQRLRQLLRFLGVLDVEGVQVTAAADLEFSAVLPLGNLDRFGVLATRLLEEIANVGDLLGPTR